MSLLTFRPEGIYCAQGGFFIDPWKPVHKAVITHAHSDHARWGMQHYLAHHQSVPIMRLRLGASISVQGVEYGEVVEMNGVKVSFHPAGHIIGSAQVRVEYQGEVWVASGDYKTTDDGYCAAFEPVNCHAFITESTFGLPIYKWRPQQELYTELNEWWKKNRAAGKTSVVFCYALGKAQRVLHGLDETIGKIFTHGSVHNVNQALIDAGHVLKKTNRVEYATGKKDTEGALILAPPSAEGTPWMKRFASPVTAIASGWMNLRGTRRRRNADMGLPLSDHADWEGLLWAIRETGAEKVFVTHGYTTTFAQYLRECGYDARPVQTEYGDDEEEVETTSATEKEEEP